MARPESRAVWDRFASKKGLYESRVRDAVIDAFFATSEHVDLQALFEAARRRHPRVGLATVYRTMKLLDEAGLAQPCASRTGGGPCTRWPARATTT
jgi:Fur family ferric uptake transcriptional regulator